MRIKTLLQKRPGTSLLETMLFLGILGIISGTIVSVLMATQDARIRQRSVAELEQQGTQILTSLTKVIRRAERIIVPATNNTGAILLLQMAQNDEYPTIVSRVGSGELLLVQRSSTSSLISSNLTVQDLTFRNIDDGNVWLSFKLVTIIPTLSKQIYSRTFNGTATLFHDDQNDAGGCGTCPAPVCINGAYTWYICESGICSQSDTTLAC